MNILITLPSYAQHGGIRIAIEIANRLAESHNVTLFSLYGEKHKDYWEIDSRITFLNICLEESKAKLPLADYDCLFITSPHTYFLTKDKDCPKKVFLHLQMLEHMFWNSSEWMKTCAEMYQSPHPMFSISAWNIGVLKNTFRRQAETIYIGNGLNTSHFPIEKNVEKDCRTILVEGWEGGNPCKDVDHIGPWVARKLRNEGYTILAYGRHEPKILPSIPSEFYISPSIEELNTLYRRASILLKTTRYDARACAPIEAGSKGCITVRGIIAGDDDLIGEWNCEKVYYNKGTLYSAMKKLLGNEKLQEYYRENMYQTVEVDNNWTKWMEIINSRICL